MAKVVAVSGYKNSGKTALCLKLLEELNKLGIRTGYIKRTCEDVILNKDSDTGRVFRMGTRTLLWGKDGARIESPFDQPGCEDGAALRLMLSRYFPEAEIVVMEGGKNIPVPKIWVRSENEEIPEYPGIFYVYDRFGKSDGEKVFGDKDEPKLAARLARLVRGEAYRSAKVYIGDTELPMKDFVADFIRGGMLGMLSALKWPDRQAAAPIVRVYADIAAEEKRKGLSNDSAIL